MRTLIANRESQACNVKINKILWVYKSIREVNDIHSQSAPRPDEAVQRNLERIELLQQRAATLRVSENRSAEAKGSRPKIRPSDYGAYDASSEEDSERENSPFPAKRGPGRPKKSVEPVRSHRDKEYRPPRRP